MIVSKGLHIGLLLRSNLRRLAGLIVYDVAITVAFVFLDWHWIAIPALPLPLLGSAIALIITLRNNAAYARWWEARTLWGAILNNSRSLARGVLALLGEAPVGQDLIRAQIAYALALRCHLLRIPAEEVIARYLPPAWQASCLAAANRPAAIQMAMSRQIGEIGRQGGLDTVGIAALDRTLAALVDAQGGLERIRNTPMPRQYSAVPLVFSLAYCFLLPLGLVEDLRIATVVGSAIVGFMFLILNEIGDDLENPFSGDVHDVPMSAVTRTVEIDLLQTIGAAEVPPPITPVDGILP